MLSTCKGWDTQTSRKLGLIFWNWGVICLICLEMLWHMMVRMHKNSMHGVTCARQDMHVRTKTCMCMPSYMHARTKLHACACQVACMRAPSCICAPSYMCTRARYYAHIPKNDTHYSKQNFSIMYYRYTSTDSNGSLNKLEWQQ